MSSSGDLFSTLSGVAAFATPPVAGGLAGLMVGLLARDMVVSGLRKNKWLVAGMCALAGAAGGTLVSRAYLKS